MSATFIIIIIIRAEDGLDAIRKYRCDLVVWDYNLPDQDGVWLVEKIRRGFTTLPIATDRSAQPRGSIDSGLESGGGVDALHGVGA
jgi:DNA-binding response OmpR family regulator